MKIKNAPKLKLNINTEDLIEEEAPLSAKVQVINTNRGIRLQDRPDPKNVSEIDLIHFFFSSPCLYHDYSYHWLEKYSNIMKIALPIEINLNLNLVEPVRDFPCEFELLKLICEDSQHKEMLLEVPKSLKKLNRYTDILPCKLYIIKYYILDI
jgi:hypothetical protein